MIIHSDIIIEKAVDQDHAEAQYNLGRIFSEEGNIKQAQIYLQKAADQNHIAAQAILKFYMKNGYLSSQSTLTESSWRSL